MYKRHLHGALSATCVLAAIAAATIAAGGPAYGDGLYRGPAFPLGQGTAQAWVLMGTDGQPEALGVSLSEAAFRDLEAVPDAALTLTFPAEANGTGFDHVLLNWNRHGHPPAEIWGTAHFDVHFYLTPPAAREAVAESDPEYMAKALRHPEARFMPADYAAEPEPVPGMGMHWVDRGTPEFHGKPFTHTLIYGAWDGRVTFIEPMVDKTVFDGRETVVATVKQPAAVAVPGRYPTRYRIDYDPAAAEHRIVLEGLIARE